MGSPVRVLLLAVVLGMAAPVAVRAGTPAQVIHANREAAASAADQLLGQLVLPAESTQVPSEPAGDAHQLARPFELFPFAAEVDRHVFWTTPASPSAVIASVRAHLPAGAKSTGSGFTGTSTFAGYSLPTVMAPALGPRSLEVDAVELPNGNTGVRADAVVRYRAPRLPTQRIPFQARVLDITIANYGSKPLLSITVTRRSRVRRVAAVVDALPFAADLRGVAISCPAIRPAPIDTFSFRGSRGGRVLAKVTEPANTPTGADLCATTPLTIRGHREPALLDGGSLLRRAGAILGVRLTRP